jgi:hypothetical protein
MFNLRKFAETQDVGLAGNQLTVYHRTGSGGSVSMDKSVDVADMEKTSQGICQTGFLVGGGAAYGPGVYTTYTLKSSLQNYNLKTYGAYVVRGKMDITNFIICDYDLAKKVYGENYRLTDQFKAIGLHDVLKKSYNYLEDQSKRLSSTAYSSDVASSISRRLKLENLVNGIIFTGRNDGCVALAYNQFSVIPDSYAFVDARTAKKIYWIDQPNNLKGYFDERKNQSNNEKKKFNEERKRLAFSFKNDEQIDRSNFPNIQEEFFEDVVVSILYIHPHRMSQLSQKETKLLGNKITNSFKLKNFEKAPTVFWADQDNEEFIASLPDFLKVYIWEKFISQYPAQWGDVPVGIKESLNKSIVGQYWANLSRKKSWNDKTWKRVPVDILQYMKDQRMARIPHDVLQEAEHKLQSEEIKENEAIDDVFDGSEISEVVEVPSHLELWVKEEIGKLNAKATRLGLPLLKVEVLQVIQETNSVKMQIVGKMPAFNGWQVVSKLSDIKLDPESDDRTRVIEQLGNMEPPDHIDAENTKLICEHCNTNVRRNTSYIMYNEDDKEYKIIGGTCLGDFVSALGKELNPTSIVNFIELIKNTIKGFNNQTKQSPSKVMKQFKNSGVPVNYFLSRCLMSLKRKKTIDLNSVWNSCINALTDSKNYVELSSLDLVDIQKMIDWINTYQDDDDIVNQIKEAFKIGFVFKKGRGFKNSNASLISRLPSVYLNRVKEGEHYSERIGDIGSTAVIEGEIISYSPIFLQVIQQADINRISNNIVIKDRNGEKVAFHSEDNALSIGSNLKIKGTISGYSFVDNSQVTVLDQVSIIDNEEYNQKRKFYEASRNEYQNSNKDVEGTTIVAVDYKKLNGQEVDLNLTLKNVDTRAGRHGQYHIFKFVDNVGNQLSSVSFKFKDKTYESLLQKDGQEVSIRATIQLKAHHYKAKKSPIIKRVTDDFYINLEKCTVIGEEVEKIEVDPVDPVTSVTPTVIKNVYNDRDTVNDVFKIKYKRSFQSFYGNGEVQSYMLIDSTGAIVSTMTTRDLGEIGSFVEINGTIDGFDKINNPKLKLSRARSAVKTNISGYPLQQTPDSTDSTDNANKDDSTDNVPNDNAPNDSTPPDQGSKLGFNLYGFKKLGQAFSTIRNKKVK